MAANPKSKARTAKQRVDVLKYVQEHANTTSAAIAVLLNIPGSTVRNYLVKLRVAGKVKQHKFPREKGIKPLPDRWEIGCDPNPIHEPLQRNPTKNPPPKRSEAVQMNMTRDPFLYALYGNGPGRVETPETL